MRFRDAHTHLSAGACDLADLDVRGVSASAELMKAVARGARERPPGRWVRAWGWSGPPPGGDPCPDHPLWIVRADGHAAWLNAAAGHVLGIAAGCVDEAALDAVRGRLPAPSDAERDGAVSLRLDELRRLGIGAVDDMVEAWGPALWARLRADVEIGMWVPAGTSAGDVERLRREFPPERGGVALRGVKLFLDGTLGARTAALSAPYADLPGERGSLRMGAEELRETLRPLGERRVPVAIHAIGDRAVSVALDALEALPRPAWGAHRIEHAQVVAREDVPRFALAGVVASLQPGHFADDRAWLPARLGAREQVLVHPLASFLTAGVTVVLGSDWPVSTWDPDAIVAAASDPARGPEAIPRELARGLLSA